MALLAVYLYVTCLTLFGCVHLGLMLCDARTKDILMRRQACCPVCAYGFSGACSAWRRQWCGAVHLRPWAHKVTERPRRVGMRPEAPSIQDGEAPTEPLLPAAAEELV